METFPKQPLSGMLIKIHKSQGVLYLRNNEINRFTKKNEVATDQSLTTSKSYNDDQR